MYFLIKNKMYKIKYPHFDLSYYTTEKETDAKHPTCFEGLE